MAWLALFLLWVGLLFGHHGHHGHHHQVQLPICSGGPVIPGPSCYTPQF